MIRFDNQEVIDNLKEELERRFGLSIKDIKKELPLMIKRGSQHNAEDLLAETEKSKKINHSDIALGITEEDLYVPDLNFVFGLASPDLKCAVISTNRLASHDRLIYHDRVLKEAVHELGHVFGLRHCPDRRCVMHFSNSLLDTDIKKDEFCTVCSDLLRDSG